MNRTFYKYSNKVGEFFNNIIFMNPDYIVPVKKKGCKLLKYANIDSSIMDKKVRYIDYFINNEIDLVSKKVCIVDDATKYTSRLLHYREFFSEKGAEVYTFSYIAHEMLKNGEREQYDEKAKFGRYLGESTYQEYLIQQSRVLVDDSNSFDIDHLVVETHLTQEKYLSLLDELYKIGDIEYVNDKYTSRDIDKISVINIDFYDTESLFDSSVAQGALQKIRLTYYRSKEVLYIAPLSFPVWNSKISDTSNLFSKIKFELPYETTNNITDMGIYYDLVYVFQIVLLKFFFKNISSDLLSSEYKIVDSDMVAYIGNTRTKLVLESAKKYLASDWENIKCLERHNIDVPRKGYKLFHSLNDMMDELRNHYNNLVEETQTLIGVRYYLAYEEILERYSGHENILKWIDILCDRGVLVTRNYQENGIYFRACRSGETNYDFDEQKSGAFVFLAINICGDKINKDGEIMCEVSPTYINKVLANFAYDYSTTDYDCHSIKTKPYDFGPLAYIEDVIDGNNDISLYNISAITKFCLFDEEKRKFYAYWMKNQKIQDKINDIIGSQDDISFSETVAYFDFIKTVKQTQGSANFLNALAICRDENTYYKYVRFNLTEAFRYISGAINSKNNRQIEKYLRASATMVNSAKTKLRYDQNEVLKSINAIEVPIIYEQARQKIIDTFEMFSEDFNKVVYCLLQRICFEEFLLVNLELYLKMYDSNYLLKVLDQYIKQDDINIMELNEISKSVLTKDDINNCTYDEISSVISGITDKLFYIVKKDIQKLKDTKPLLDTRKESRKKIVSNIKRYYSKNNYENILIVSFSYSGYSNINDERELNVVKNVQNLIAGIHSGGKMIVGREENDFGVFVTDSLKNAIDFSKKLWKLSSCISDVFFRIGCCLVDTKDCLTQDIENALITSYMSARTIEDRNSFVMDKTTYQNLKNIEDSDVMKTIRKTSTNEEYYEYDEIKHKYIVKKYTHNTDESVRIGIITALNEENIAMESMLENCVYVEFPGRGAGNQFTMGEIKANDGNNHKIALAITSGDGNNKAAIRAEKMIEHFPNIEVIFMVGIAGGTPALPVYASDMEKLKEKHVRLGDVVISNGIFQYDYIKQNTNSWIPKGQNIPPCARVMEAQQKLDLISEKENVEDAPWNIYISDALRKLKSSYKRPSVEHDKLHDYNGELIEHPFDEKRSEGYPKVFKGKIASSNSVLKNPMKRDELKAEHDVYAIEMETSGIADTTWEAGIGYYGVRGICDYCDKFKNDEWHKYAALVAAAYTKAIIEWMST